MKIYLTDKKRWIRVTTQEALNILKSGLKPEEWTASAIQKYLLY